MGEKKPRHCDRSRRPEPFGRPHPAQGSHALQVPSRPPRPMMLGCLFAAPRAAPHLESEPPHPTERPATRRRRAARRQPNRAAHRARAQAVRQARPDRPATAAAHRHPRRAHAQPEEHRPRHPEERAGRDHRPLGLRQVESRVRHAVRGRPAPLRGEPVAVRAAVPAADGQAGCGPDRRPVARDLDRAESHQPQPALHRRHRDRDPRLPAAALRTGRHALLPRPQIAAAIADRLANGRCGACAAAGHAPHDPGAGRAREKRRVHRTVHRDAGAGLCAVSRGRRDSRARRPARVEKNREARHRRRDRPHQGPSRSRNVRARRAAATHRRELRSRVASGRGPRDRGRDE